MLNSKSGFEVATVSKLLKRVPEIAADDEEQIELLRISLKGKFSVLEDLDKSILGLVEEGNIDEEIEESEGIKDEIHLNLLKLDLLLKELKTPSQPSPVSTSSQATGSTSHSTKLPKLLLKKFSGDPKTWPKWWDSFKVAVHENGSSNVEKFNHLRSQVEIHVRGLQAQGVDSAQYGTLLIPIMVAKIPEDLRLKLILSRQFCGDN